MKKPFDIKERSFQFALEVVNLCRTIQKTQNEFALSKQLLRSATAVGALIRQAQNAESGKDFIHKMAIAQKECDESIYWIELIEASDLHDTKILNPIKDEAEQLLKIIRTIILNKRKTSVNEFHHS